MIQCKSLSFFLQSIQFCFKFSNLTLQLFSTIYYFGNILPNVLNVILLNCNLFLIINLSCLFLSLFGLCDFLWCIFPLSRQEYILLFLTLNLFKQLLLFRWHWIFGRSFDFSFGVLNFLRLNWILFFMNVRQLNILFIYALFIHVLFIYALFLLTLLIAQTLRNK